ncbi:MAG: GerMN domain-containing protein [Acidimicrobiia bacterium]|jgi:hypothetical protein
MDDRRFRQAFHSIVEEAPDPPRWDALVAGRRRVWSDFARRPVVAFLAGAVFVLVVVGITTLVGGDTPPPAIGTTTTTTVASTTVAPPTSGAAIEQMACGKAFAPYSTTIPEGSELDQAAGDALEALQQVGEGQFFTDLYEFRSWSQDDEEQVLLGYPRSTDTTGYAYAHFERQDGEWVPTGFGQCHWQPVAEGYGLASWRLEGEIDPDDTTLTVLATEQECAGGQIPEGREIVDATFVSDSEITVFILVAPIEGDATCPSNPEFEYEVTLDRPIAGRSLLDGSEIPPSVRYVPPIEGCPFREPEPGQEYLEIYLRCRTTDGQQFRAVPRAVDNDTVVSFAGLLRELLRGPSAEELSDGYVSVFSLETGDALDSAEVSGTMAVVDFRASIQVNNLSTSTGAVELQAELLQNVFSVHELESVEFRINGSCEAWSAFLQSDGCRTYTRDDLVIFLGQLD